MRLQCRARLANRPEDPSRTKRVVGQDYYEHVVAETLPKTAIVERDGKAAKLDRTHRPAPFYEVHPLVEQVIYGGGKEHAGHCKHLRTLVPDQRSSVAHTTLTNNTVKN